MTGTDWAERPNTNTNGGAPPATVDVAELAKTIDTSHSLAAEARAMDAAPSTTKIEVPEVTQAGGIATRSLKTVTDSIVAQIDAAMIELQNLRTAVISTNETTQAQVERQVQLGTVVGQIVVNIRAGFRPPAG